MPYKKSMKNYFTCGALKSKNPSKSRKVSILQKRNETLKWIAKD
jgi:hypothetical protein